jgi:hypothetical protein
MASPIAEAAARYRAIHARVITQANEAAEAIRRDLGLPRDRRKWSDHPGLWNDLNTQVVTRLEQARTQAVADLRAARDDTRRRLYAIRTGPEGGINRTMAEMDYRQAREYALALPLGETGFHMAMERMRLAVLTGDEPAMAALSLLAEERTDGQRGTAWDHIPQMWEQATANRFTQEALAELREAADALDQLASPARFSMPKLTPIEPEPEPAPSLASTSGNGDEPPAVG